MDYVQRFYVDSEGNFLGSYTGPEESMPANLVGAIEVPSSPGNGMQKWDFVNGVWLPLPPQPYTVAVEEMWLRMTDEEAEEFDAAMNTASPLRLRRAFRSANSITSMTEVFGFVQTVMNGLFSATRVGELLAPSSEVHRGGDAE